MTQEEISALLGRPLTANEVTNFDLYLEIAREQLEELLCFSLDEVNEERTFNAREGYSTLFTGPFTSVSAVSINGTAVADTKYTSYLWDKRNSDWYNSLVFADKFQSGDEVAITATWGFNESMPVDLQQLYAKLFALASSGGSGDTNVKSKKVEDFSITYETDKTAFERLINASSQTINKYSLCAIGELQSGEVCD